MNKLETFHLLSHPSFEQINEQMQAQMGVAEDAQANYGPYTVMSIEASVLEVPSLAIIELLIAPRQLRIGKTLGSFLLEGIAADGREAIVAASPLASNKPQHNSLGSIVLF